MDVLNGLLKMFDVRSLLLLAAVFVPFEHLASLRPWQKTFRKHFLTDMAYFFINPLPIALGSMLVTVLIVNNATGWVPGAIPAAIRSQPLFLQVVEALVIGDIGQYLAHRAFHTFPFLWKFHEIHHGAEDMDWLVAFHVHAVDQIVTSAAKTVPVFLLGYSDSAIALFLVIINWHAILVHANAKMNWGPLNWIIVSPQYHHWHHANERSAYDLNYSASFPLIDMIGGTFHMPSKDEYPKRYGVDRPVGRGYLAQFINPFLPRRKPTEVAARAEAQAVQPKIAPSVAATGPAIVKTPT